MFDKELVFETLKQIKTAVKKISVRFQSIEKVSDFTDSPYGVDMMDAICMMLIVIGESIKNLDKMTNGKLLACYPEIDWKKAKGMRDIMTHCYANVDAEVVFYTCQNKIPLLGETVDKIIEGIEWNIRKPG